LPAIISLFHRISGILLFFPGIPLLLYALHLMLGSQEGFEKLQTFLLTTLVKVGMLFVVWLFLHHLFAGIRHLALDLHYGLTLIQARATSKLVLAAGLILTILFGLAIW
jgi:succinate dehydrogenase / fumarate reductase cytochrome b subunit